MIGTARPASWPPRKGLSASRSASDTRGHISVSPETGVFGRRDRPGANRELAPSCYRATCPHRPDSHQGRRRFSGRTRGGCEDRARYYHPTFQRFISEDPIASAAYQGCHRGIGMASADLNNLYAYVRNRPTMLMDPSGLGPCEDDLRICMEAARDWGNQCRTRVFEGYVACAAGGLAACAGRPNFVQCLAAWEAACAATASLLWGGCTAGMVGQQAVCLQNYAVCRWKDPGPGSGGGGPGGGGGDPGGMGGRK
jgi:RHS repeat-associated protein